MRHPWLSLVLPLALLWGCTPTHEGGQEGSEWQEGDADTDSDTDADPAWTGPHVYIYGEDQPSVGTYQCELVWMGEGTTSSATCDDCAFVYDVQFTYDADASTDDGSCTEWATDWQATLAYTDDADGAGPALLREEAGEFLVWGAAEFDGTTLTYSSGEVDVPDGDVFDSAQHAGEATITR